MMLNYATLYQRSIKDFTYVKLSHTLSTVQTKNLHDVKLCLDLSDWLLKTLSFESLYNGLCPDFSTQTHDI